VSPARWPGALGIGDRVRLGGRDQTVIGLAGPVVRLADTDGRVVAVSVAELMAAEGFAVLDARPRVGMPVGSALDGLDEEAAAQARWWQRHIVEVLRGVPPDAEQGTPPRPEYDPAVVSLTGRERAKATELTAGGHPVSASAVAHRRRRYQQQGLAGMVDHRAGRQMPTLRRTDDALVAAMRQAIGEATDDSTRTAAFVFRRTRQILAASDGGETATWPSRRTLYPLFARLSAGWHTTGSARTRRSLAARPAGPFGQVAPVSPDDLMQIDSTPLDVLVRLSDGVCERVDLTGHRRRDQVGDRGGAAADDQDGGRERAAGPDRHSGADAPRAGRRRCGCPRLRCRFGGCSASTSGLSTRRPVRSSSRRRSSSIMPIAGGEFPERTGSFIMGKPKSRVCNAFVPGPLEQYASGFRTWLLDKRYTPLSTVPKLQLMAHVSRWLEREGLTAAGLRSRRPAGG